MPATSVNIAASSLSLMTPSHQRPATIPPIHSAILDHGFDPSARDRSIRFQMARPIATRPPRRISRKSQPVPDIDRPLPRVAESSPCSHLYRWAKLKPTILSFWVENDGKLTQKKLNEVRRKVSIASAQRSVAGKASSRARALKNKETQSTNVNTNVQRHGQRDGKIQNQNHITPPTSPSGKPARTLKRPDIEHEIARLEGEIRTLQEGEIHGVDNTQYIEATINKIMELTAEL